MFDTFSSPKLIALQHRLQNGDSVLIEQLWNSPKALIASLAQQATGKHILLLTGSSQEELGLFHDFALFTQRPVVDFPSWETLPSENIAPSPDVVGERYQVLETLLTTSEPHIILTNLQACLQKLIDPTLFRSLSLKLTKGDSFGYEKLIKQIEKMGYQKKSVATDKGEYAVRGGIVDLFPVSSPDPYRIEFWGDEIDSIRIYDPIGQTSIRIVDSLLITPGQELELLEKSSNLSSILDYIKSNCLVIFDDLLALEDRYATLVGLAEGKLSGPFSSIESFLDAVNPLQKIFFTQQPIEELSQVNFLEKLTKSPLYEISFEMFNRKLTAKRWMHPFIKIGDYFSPEEEITGEEILQSLKHVDEQNGSLTILCPSELEESNFHKKVLEQKIQLPRLCSVRLGYLSCGFAFTDGKQVLLPLTEITQRYKMRRQKLRSTYHTAPSESYELVAGDMVVHIQQGIGRYLGLEKRPNHSGVMSDFMLIEYAEKAKLYVPLSQAHLVSKYIGSNSEIVPKMHTIGGNRWKKTRELTEQAIKAYASELLQIYARRELRGGYVYPRDSDDTIAFEEEFPFEETEDQLRAIAEMKEDMCSPKAMDRLVCGDVGYGKTEVALRAAFKAVVDGRKQVAILVPTTVLAMQHHENFQERMANFPINVGVLSRFLTPKEIRATLEGVAKGSIDIVIGTHRIISEDVKFKDLGLIIIDEEQRFGVKAKEHLKKIKDGVDCLTLSATPIPRTLYMSLIGARDMSIISTPPQDRLPIKTIITEPNDQTIKNALLRELARDGQAYVIHNRVETIFEMAARIKKLIPQANVVVGHGQMSADEIDSVFHAFKSGRADILVATTIVENGIDIPNANTIIIDRADRFGLADLYQMRGRVGRWNRRAYAYFLVPRLNSIPEITRYRLNALAESSGYGGGMKIAMRDLEIRGAGDILGIEQSGQVSAIGFHLYCKMLKKTMHTLQGTIPASLYDTKIDTDIDARLPEDYMGEVSLRMEFYQKLGEAATTEEVDEIYAELKDRFGPPPLPAEWLYRLTRVKIKASQIKISSIKVEKASVTIESEKAGKTMIRKVLLPPSKTPKQWEENLLKVMQSMLQG